MFLRTLLLLMLVVGTAVRPALVMICELQAAGGGDAHALVAAADAAHVDADGDGDSNPHSHGSHGVLQNIAPDVLAAILPAFEVAVAWAQPLRLPDMTASPPPLQPATQPFRPPIA